MSGKERRAKECGEGREERGEKGSEGDDKGREGRSVHRQSILGQCRPCFSLLNYGCTVCVQVAENLLNPFGGDDDDFEINPLIETNLQVTQNTRTSLPVFTCEILYLYRMGDMWCIAYIKNFENRFTCQSYYQTTGITFLRQTCNSVCSIYLFL